MKKGNNKKDREKNRMIRMSISEPASTVDKVKKIRKYESARSDSFAVQKAIEFYYEHLVNNGSIKVA